MNKTEKLKESIKDRLRLIFLSIIFLTSTTFVSCFCVYLPNWFWPEQYTGFDLGSTVVGSFIGQITLLVAMQILSVFFKSQKDKEENEANKT